MASDYREICNSDFKPIMLNSIIVQWKTLLVMTLISTSLTDDTIEHSKRNTRYQLQFNTASFSKEPVLMNICR